MAYKINLSELFLVTFGIRAFKRYFPPLAQPRSEDIEYTGLKTLDVKKETTTSVLDTPIFMPVIFEAGSYSLINEEGEEETIGYAQYNLPDTTLVEFSRAKKIIKTEIAGARARGTVKEQIGYDDYRIKIRGLLVNFEDNNFPSDQVQELKNFFETDTSVKVNGEIFDLLGIKEVVCENLELLAIEGVQNVQPFILDLVSDEPVEIKIAKGL